MAGLTVRKPLGHATTNFGARQPFDTRRQPEGQKGTGTQITPVGAPGLTVGDMVGTPVLVVLEVDRAVLQPEGQVAPTGARQPVRTRVKPEGHFRERRAHETPRALVVRLQPDGHVDVRLGALQPRPAVFDFTRVQPAGQAAERAQIIPRDLRLILPATLAAIIVHPAGQDLAGL